MNENKIKSLIKNALHNKEEIFDKTSKFLLYSIKQDSFLDNNKQYITFYVPKKIEMDVPDGIKLINNKGYISICETYQKINTHDLIKVAHSYKYISDEFIYKCYCKDKSSSVDLKYNFRYDKDLINDRSQSFTLVEPCNHLQVLHEHPRFESIEMNLDIFLATVKRTCIDKNSNPYCDPVYKIRHIL